jgi:teichoic acid transport system permease protein
MSITVDDGSRTAGLTPIRLSSRLPIAVYLRDMWRRRDYMRYVPIFDLKSQHLDTVLGNFWHVLNPLMLIGVYYLVFGLGLRAARGLDHYIAFLSIGVFIFHFTQKSTMQGARSIVNNESLIRAIKFPRMVLPVSGVVTELIAFLPALLVMFVVVVLNDVPLRLAWLAIVPIIGLQLLLNLGFALTAARFTTTVRDMENVLPHVFRIAFYVSGILFSVEERVESERLRELFALNPVYALVTAARSVILGTPASGLVWLSLVVWSFGSIVVGFVLFRRAEEEYGRV